MTDAVERTTERTTAGEPIPDLPSAPAIRGRRGGGRAARRAARAAPLPENLRPVRAGLEGGAYAPLDEAGVARIHETALRALEEIGLANAPASGIEALTAAGAVPGEDGRVRIPRAVVEEMLGVAARDLTPARPGSPARPSPRWPARPLRDGRRGGVHL